jgi:hypothetical protein
VPKILEWRGYKFFFFSNEGDPLEPCHIHIRKDGNVAKFWVVPVISLVSSWGMTPKELNRLEAKVHEIKPLIEERWNDYFNL